MARPSLLVTRPAGAAAANFGSSLRIHDAFFVDGPPDGSHREAEPGGFLWTRLADLWERLDSELRTNLLDWMVVVPLTKADFQHTVAGLSGADELLLRYPEVYWYFLLPEHEDPATLCVDYGATAQTIALHIARVTQKDSLSNAIRCHAFGFRNCFDATGFRKQVIHRVTLREVQGKAEARTAVSTDEVAGEDARVASPCKPRIRTAASIEDEESFLLFNGYLLYRFEYNTFLVSTREAMRAFESTCVARVDAVLEDLLLSVPDAEQTELQADAFLPNAGECSSQLASRRAEKYSWLPKHKKRVLISAVGLGETCEWTSLVKPYGGMFDPTLSFLYDPPPAEQGVPHHHSAPGRHQRIAADLLASAQRLLTGAEGEGTGTVVHAALLSLDAQRLLDNAASALSLEALSVQHQAEVMAECGFIGTANRLDVRARLEDMRDRVRRIVEAKGEMHETKGKLRAAEQELNAVLQIAGHIHGIYRNHEQFDEAETLSRELYRLHLEMVRIRLPLVAGISRRLWSAVGRPNRSGSNPTRFGRLLKTIRSAARSSAETLALGPRYYFGWLLQSGSHLFFACLAWVFVFGTVYYTAFHALGDFGDAWQALLNAAFHFVSFQAPPVNRAFEGFVLPLGGYQREYEAVVLLNCICGYVHLGIFISFLYTRISRR